MVQRSAALQDGAELEDGNGMRIVVLGAGVVGTTTAWALWKDGHEVTVVERREGAGLETSWGNGALLHPSSVEPWAAPGLPRKLLGWLGKDDAPFLVRLGALPSVAGWGMQFLANCTQDAFEATYRWNLELALETLEAMAAIRAETGIAYERAEALTLKVYDDEETLDAAEHEVRMLEPLGLRVERLDARAAAALEPALERHEGPIAGALHFPQDEMGDCHLFTDGLARWLAARGVAFRFGTSARRVVHSGDVASVDTDRERIDADAVVLAAGAHAPGLVRGLGVALPVAPVKGLSLTAPREAWNDAPRKALLFEKDKFALVPIGERVRIAGTAELTGFDTRPDPKRAKAVVAKVTRRFPAFGRCAQHDAAVLWAGLRPMSASGRPFIGPTRLRGLFVNAGHGHMGWTLAAGSAKRVAAAVSAAS